MISGHIECVYCLHAYHQDDRLWCDLHKRYTEEGCDDFLLPDEELSGEGAERLLSAYESVDTDEELEKFIEDTDEILGHKVRILKTDEDFKKYL